VKLADLPTPLDDARRLAEALGVERLLIKRDDNTGLALGGNKARKLEYLMAEAQAMGVKVVLTCGGAQSNHARMTAAAARKLGMECIIFLTDPVPETFEGNLLLDAILDAGMRFLGGVTYEELEGAMNREAAHLISQARIPYVVPVGGSTPLGAMGYVNAVREVAGQLEQIGVEEVDIVAAYGSGGTLAGLLVGCYLFLPKSRIIGISVSKPIDNALPRVVRIANEAAKLVGMGHEPELGRLTLYDEYIGEGYAIPTEGCKEAILLTARTEGIILDPVYTGKAMAGLIDLVRKGELGRDRPLLFWHTGGTAALFAFESLFHDEGIALSESSS
jgi:D-cysteine desulfhydrase family pyridoxal phosphate-dependent enzyme